MIWTITVEEADDGSGDLVLPFTQEILDYAGWKEGDTLEWIDNKNGTWSLRKKDDRDYSKDSQQDLPF